MREKIGLALLAVYVIWGSTYFALKHVLTDAPPFLVAGSRYLIASAVLGAWVLYREGFDLRRQQVRNACIVGVILGVGGNGGVTYAQYLGVSSSVVAMIVCTMPVCAAVWARFGGEKLLLSEWIALALGILGTAILFSDRTLAATSTGLIVAVASPILWSVGSVFSRHNPMPNGLSNTAIQLFASGIALSSIAIVRGERLTHTPSWSAFGYWVYLIVFGTLIAYSAYVYLLKHARAVVATSYAFVNPIIATALGYFIDHEVVSARMLIALPLVLTGVALAVWAKANKKPSSRPERTREEKLDEAL